MRLRANHVSIENSGGEFVQVSFDSEARSEVDFELSEPDHPYLLVQRQFEDDDGGVCYIETQDHDTYAGHFQLRLIEVTPTRLAFEIARTENKYVEVTYDLDAKEFDEVQRIVHIIFGVQGQDNILCVWSHGVLADKAMLIKPAICAFLASRSAERPRSNTCARRNKVHDSDAEPASGSFNK